MPSDDDAIRAEDETTAADEPLSVTEDDASFAEEPPAPGIIPPAEVASVPHEPVTAVETETEPEPEPEPEPESPSAAADHPVPNAADAALVEGVGGGLTWVPFACYMGAWVILAGVTAYLLAEATGETPARWTPIYTPLVWAGVALTAVGPVLSVVVWLVTRARRPKAVRRGLFASAMTRGALIAFFGVSIWLGTLFVLEILAARGTL